MITRAIVESIISPTKIRIRIPILDGSSFSTFSTDNDSLMTATVCSLPNCYINVQIGDIVFVGFEDNTYHKAVILGHMKRDVLSTSYSDISLGNLKAVYSADLPVKTNIGNITSDNLLCLSGVSDNIQNQINLLNKRLLVIEELLNDTKQSVPELPAEPPTEEQPQEDEAN